MRVLLTGHFALDAWPLGWWMRDLGQALRRAGHEVRGLLVASEEKPGDEPFPTARVVCRAGDAGADVDFAPPCFGSEGGSSQTFETLSDEQVRRYRDAWRRRLDHEVDRFDPHVIHAVHLWWDAQLALETGVPYVVSAWSAELTACADQPRAPRYATSGRQTASMAFLCHTLRWARPCKQHSELCPTTLRCCPRPSIGMATSLAWLTHRAHNFSSNSTCRPIADQSSWRDAARCR